LQTVRFSLNSSEYQGANINGAELLVGSAGFVMSMERIQLKNAGSELMLTVELERLKLEASLNSEIALALNMAASPVIKRHFLAPWTVNCENRPLRK
jgi:hypothetical protein